MERFKEHNIDIVIGKAKVGGREVEVMVDQGLRLGNGVIHLISERGEQIFNQRLFCLGCGIGYEPLDPRLFSFNSQQGRCPACEGAGTIKLEMNFLPPAFVRCETCNGKRFSLETLDIEARLDDRERRILARMERLRTLHDAPVAGHEGDGDA